MKFDHNHTLEQIFAFLVARGLRFHLQPLTTLKKVQFSVYKRGGCIATYSSPEARESVITAMNQVDWSQYPELS